MEYTRKVSLAYSKNRKGYRSTDEYVLPLLKSLNLKGKAVLDFGCGDGSDIRTFLKMGARKAVGIDPSGPMIALAKARGSVGKKVRIRKTDGRTIPEPDGKFDLVFAHFVVHYLRDTAKHFKEIARVLRSGGYFTAVFNTLTGDPKLLNRTVMMRLGKKGSVLELRILSKSPEEIKKSLKEARLDILKFIYIPNPDVRIGLKADRDVFKKRTVLLLAQKP